ncbi:MAG: hypothetical protein ACXVB9_16390 [Bdellovibrionota bacterium]
MKSLTLITLAVLFTSQAAFAESEGAKVKEDTQQAWSNTKKLVKKESRKADDKACPYVNGKLDCAAKKVKHRAQNATDSMKN